MEPTEWSNWGLDVMCELKRLISEAEQALLREQERRREAARDGAGPMPDPWPVLSDFLQELWSQSIIELREVEHAQAQALVPAGNERFGGWDASDRSEPQNLEIDVIVGCDNASVHKIQVMPADDHMGIVVTTRRTFSTVDELDLYLFNEFLPSIARRVAEQRSSGGTGSANCG